MVINGHVYTHWNKLASQIIQNPGLKDQIIDEVEEIKVLEGKNIYINGKIINTDDKSKEFKDWTDKVLVSSTTWLESFTNEEERPTIGERTRVK